MKGSPDNAELLNLSKELEEIIALTEGAIAETDEASATTTPAIAGAGTRKRPADSSSSYPSTADAYSIPIASYSVGDTVQARWTTGDNAFYPARITSITGSTKNPVYIVSFTSYNTTETLTPKDIKPVQGHSNKKSKPTPASNNSVNATNSSNASTPISSTVISQAPTLNPGAMEAGKKDGKDGDPLGKKTARKVKATKELAESQTKWQSFASKGVKTTKSGKAKKIGEGSMFRVPEGIHGRGKFAFLLNFLPMRLYRSL